MNTPATAARWEGRRLLGAFVALVGLFLGLMPLVASANPPNQFIPNPPPTNQAWEPPGAYARYPFLAGVWDATCDVATGSIDFAFDAQVLYKVFSGPRPGTNQGMINQFNSHATGLDQDNLAQGSYVAYAQAKNTATNQQLVNTPPGWPWWHGFVSGHPSGWIKYLEFTIGMDCIPTTTTTAPTTTTTEPTTTTTEPTTTTTEPTTTTTDPVTSTTVPETSTTVPETTTTTDEVGPTVVTSTTQPDTELPLTGAFADAAAWLAMVFIALGLLMVTLTRRTDET